MDDPTRTQGTESMHKARLPLATLMLAALLLGGLASTGQAFWLDALFDHCEKGAKVNERWPSPYICPDRVYAHAPFNAMVRNGWRRQNLLGAHHFNEDSTKLTQAGKLKVRWIMTQAPPAYRRVFVERSIVASDTQRRIATANAFASSNTTGGEALTVVDTHIVSEGRPASTVDYVNSQFRENMPVPVLPVSAGEGE